MIGREGELAIDADEWNWNGEPKQNEEVRDVQCPVEGCPYVFDPVVEQVREHLERHHGVTLDGVQEIYRCWHCGVTADRRSEVAEHVRTEHSNRRD